MLNAQNMFESFCVHISGDRGFICHKLLKDICGETYAQSREGVRSRAQTPIPSIGPHTLPLAPALALLKVPSSRIRAASQLLGTSSHFPDLPQFPCEATEV